MTSLNAVEPVNSCRPAGAVSDAVGQLVKKSPKCWGTMRSTHTSVYSTGKKDQMILG